MNDEFYMNLAIDEAWKYQFLTYPNPAVGCLILSSSGKILSCEAHQKAGEPHAELNAVILALQSLNPNLKAIFEIAKDTNELYALVLQNHSNLLNGASAYVSLEPCTHHGKTPPCANLLIELGFAKVVIATKDTGEHAKGGAEMLSTAGISTQIGVCKNRADELLEPFWAWSSGNFSFFKIAITQNGVASGGIISNQASRTHTHAIRNLVDILVVGGNTVRTDRPTLDTRFINDGKNPDILIYSNERKFDTLIPLFGIKDRKVIISSSLEGAFKRRFAMFEGGQNALANLDKRVKWLLIYRSNEFKDAKNVSLNLKIKIMHTTKFEDNELLWCKIID